MKKHKIRFFKIQKKLKKIKNKTKIFGSMWIAKKSTVNYNVICRFQGFYHRMAFRKKKNPKGLA